MKKNLPQIKRINVTKNLNIVLNFRNPDLLVNQYVAKLRFIVAILCGKQQPYYLSNTTMT